MKNFVRRTLVKTENGCYNNLKISLYFINQRSMLQWQRSSVIQF